MLKHTNLETLVKRCAAFRKVYARISAPELKHYQLSPSEVDILIFLSNNRTINTAKELSAFLGISKGLVARGIESLLLKGYVYIETDNSDRRIQHLFLTEAAQEVIQVLLKKRSEVEAHILKGIPQEHICEYRKYYRNKRTYIGGMMNEDVKRSGFGKGKHWQIIFYAGSTGYFITAG